MRAQWLAESQLITEALIYKIPAETCEQLCHRKKNKIWGCTTWHNPASDWELRKIKDLNPFSKPTTAPLICRFCWSITQNERCAAGPQLRPISRMIKHTVFLTDGGKRSGDNQCKAMSLQIEHWSLSPAQRISHHAKCHSSCSLLSADGCGDGGLPALGSYSEVSLLAFSSAGGGWHGIQHCHYRCPGGRGCSVAPLTFHQHQRRLQ